MATMTPEQVTAELRRKAKLGKLPTDPAHMDEYNKIKSSLGNAANTMNSGTTAAGGTAAGGSSATAVVAPVDHSGEINALLDQVKARLNQPRAAFSYDPNTDPALQAAKSNVYRDAASAADNALVSLGSRGIGNSASAVRDTAQIQQNAAANINNNLIPQYRNQAYQQYQDQQAADQQDLANLSNYVSQLVGMDQQNWQNRFNYGQAIGKFGNGQQTQEAKQFEYQKGIDQRNFEYQKARDSIADERYKQQFDENVRQFGLDYALRKAQQDNQLSNANADNARLQSQAADQAFLDVWKANGTAPSSHTFADGTTIQAGTKYSGYASSVNSNGNSQKTPTSYKTDPGYADDYQYVISDPETALINLENNSSEFIKEYGVDGYNALVKAANDKIKAKQGQDALLNP